MPGYWIVKGKAVADAEALAAYNEIFINLMKRYRVKIIAGRDRVKTVEGENFPRQFILRFESYELAMQCYEDPEYQNSLTLASRAYSREVSILEGSD
ncbi:DUF1330 domain-containing protein [Brucella sp. NBRC 12950]|uniref:DUF1330 domain-containing protein n=1 Tax=Brucella sp. NBRC 12950 TaxID=2994518 RepID=UPI0024A301F4|nr:DUF1330 domain-containing protein [Brucella sp. NBRC 12950]GLU28064.1 hypothetical protein Brsp01_32970 [Brucella sp. NBRC 12950]